MFPGVPLGLAYGLGAALMWGLTDVTATFGGRRIGSLRVLVASHVVGVAVLAGLAAILGLTLPTDPLLIATVVAVGLAGTGAYLSFFTALRIGPLSVVSPITAAYGGLTVVLAVIFRGESLSPPQALGAAIATAGIALAGLVFDGGLRSARVAGRGVVFAMGALVLFAVMTVGSAGPIGDVGWLPVMLLSRVTSVVAALGLLGIALTVGRTRLAPMLAAPLPATRHAWALAGLAGLLDVIGLVSFGIGLERAETWLVGLASSFGPAVAVLVAVAVLGERLRPSQWLGLAGIGLGLAAVAAG
jgi:drug/metabolite transporter (DMT)-like permease